MGFRKRKQQPQAFREIAASQRADKNAAKEKARAPVEKSAADPALAEIAEKETGAEAPAEKETGAEAPV